MDTIDTAVYHIFSRDSGVSMWVGLARDEQDALRQLDAVAPGDEPSRFGGASGLDWAVVEPAEDLDSLRVALLACDGDVDPQVADALRLPHAHGRIDMSALPTFGGAAPAETYGVWSWDAHHQLVGDGRGDLRIEPRPDDPATLVLVHDDQVGGWTVRATELRSALRRLGWTVDEAQGLAWEPDANDPETGGAYQRLCDATTPVHQRNDTEDDDWDAIRSHVGGEMQWRQDLGERCWTLSLPVHV